LKATETGLEEWCRSRTRLSYGSLPRSDELHEGWLSLRRVLATGDHGRQGRIEVLSDVLRRLSFWTSRSRALRVTDRTSAAAPHQQIDGHTGPIRPFSHTAPLTDDFRPAPLRLGIMVLNRYNLVCYTAGVKKT